MSYTIKKKDNGHDVFQNGNWVMWVIGSEKNAQNEINKIK
jgi:ribosomal protein S6